MDEIEEAFAKRKKEMLENKFVLDNYNQIKEIKKIDLITLHEKYKSLFYIEDTKRIDIVLAAALSSQIDGETPIWLIIVGASGDMKSVQLNALKGYHTQFIQKITSKTLVNGFKNKELYPDLAPTLNKKIIVIRDMASLLKLNPIEKGEIWGQLRDLYDGFAAACSGMGTDIKYDNIQTTLLAGATPSIDGQILIHQDLGTRELIYRTNGNIRKDLSMNKCMDNEENEKNISKEINEITLNFLSNARIKRDIINKNIKDELMQIAEYISLMRASADIDSYEKSLRANVTPEEPTRLIKQIKKLYVCLMSLADDYPENRAIDILWRIAQSSSNQNRIELVNFFLKNTNIEFSMSKLSEELKKGKGTIQIETAILWNLGILNCRIQETSYPDKFYYYWKFNGNFMNKLTPRLDTNRH